MPAFKPGNKRVRLIRNADELKTYLDRMESMGYFVDRSEKAGGYHIWFDPNAR